MRCGNSGLDHSRIRCPTWSIQEFLRSAWSTTSQCRTKCGRDAFCAAVGSTCWNAAAGTNWNLQVVKLTKARQHELCACVVCSQLALGYLVAKAGLFHSTPLTPGSPGTSGSWWCLVLQVTPEQSSIQAQTRLESVLSTPTLHPTEFKRAVVFLCCDPTTNNAYTILCSALLCLHLGKAMLHNVGTSKSPQR